MESERAFDPYCRSRVVITRLLEQPLTTKQDERRMAQFAQYAMVAAEEALQDAGWNPKNENGLEATVLMYRTVRMCSTYIVVGCLHGLWNR